MAKTASGLEENVAGALSYFLGFLTGIFFLLTEKENNFVRFHAMQSTVVSVALFVLSFALSIIPLINVVWFVLSPFITIAAFVLWLWLMYQAYQGNEYELPWVAGFSREQLAKMDSTPQEGGGE